MTFTPNDTTDYTTVTGTVSITVNNKGIPTVTNWPTASGITYGAALSASTLTPVTAAVPGNASVAGTFAWTNPATIPGAGTPSESVTFTPTDTTDYNTIAGTVTVAVAKATPTITTPPTASPISSGQALVASTLTGGVGSVSGTFAWTNPGTIPPVGPQSESVTFTPTDAVDYNTATVNVTVTVNTKTTPTVSAPPIASPITYGQTLASSILTGGTASVAGTFAWTVPSTIPGAGTPSENVTFTPNDTTDYNTTTVNVTVTVSKVTPTVTVPPTASPISTGQTLVSSNLTGGTASVGGTFAWTNPGTIPPAGATPESVTFTPSDPTDYNTVTLNVTVTVNSKTTPTVSAPPTATPITYGQTLASSTLSGGTVVAGATPVTGTWTWTLSTIAPNAGTPSESATFTPNDLTDYNTTTANVTVTVNKATPTVTALPTAGNISLGQPLSSSVLSGGTASVNGTFSWTTPGTMPPSGTNPYPVTFTPSDTTDYNTVAAGSVSVTVNNLTTPTVTAWPTASPIFLRSASVRVRAVGWHGFRCG